MKKTNFMLPALLMAGVLCGCGDDAADSGRPAAGNGVNFALDQVTTRAAFDDNNRLQINWTSGDKVRIFCDEAEDVKQADYEVAEPTDPDNKHTSKLKYNANGLAWGTDDGTHNFYAVYPADDGKVSVSDGVATFKVNYNQTCTVNGTADADGHYSTTPDMTNAYMVANLSTKPVELVNLSFRPIMTTLEVTVRGRETQNTGTVTITGISVVNKHIQYTGNGEFSYDIANSKILLANTNESENRTGTIFVGVKDNENSFIDLEPGQSITFTVFLPPVAIGADNPVDVRVHATGDTEQTITIKGQNDVNGKAMEFPASSKGAIKLAYFPTVTIATGNNWITPLDDDIYVSQMSIPGTHDAGTGDGTTFSAGKTQELTLDEQFEMGIRAFDLRPAINASKQMILCHGLVPTTFQWDQVMERFKYYLKENPGEFIIAIIRHEDEYQGTSITHWTDENKDEKWQPAMQEKLETMKATINPSTNESYTIDFRPDLTIGEMRGKILFMCRSWTAYNNDGPIVGGYHGWSHSKDCAEVDIWGPSSTVGTLNIQDCYNRDEAGTSDNNEYLELKWQAVNNSLEKSRYFHTNPLMVNRWSYNHTSGYTSYTNGIFESSTDGYRNNAANINIKFYNKITSSDWEGSTGIILSDFVGARKSGNYTVYGDLLPQAIINNNYKYRMKRKGE